jgi:hypothetical protein
MKTIKKSKDKVILEQLWAICTDTNPPMLLWTDKEACIYDTYNTALKNRGSHKIVCVEIREVSK